MKKRSSDDKGECLTGSEAEITEQSYRIGDNKQVGNVVVWLVPPDKGHFFKIDDKQAAEAKAHPVEIEQPHCAFMPHVAVAFPKYRDPKNPRKMLPTGQEIVARNNAKITHNTNISGGADNPEKNHILEAGKTMEYEATPQAGALNVKCNIHPWMQGYLWAFDHPYAAVSRSDNGSKDLRVDKKDPAFGTYELKNAPAGVKLKVIAWHEKAGYLTAATGDEIELKDGDNTKDFEIEFK
jgi:hypothetical protein